jgi:hypothetical protein
LLLQDPARTCCSWWDQDGGKQVRTGKQLYEEEEEEEDEEEDNEETEDTEGNGEGKDGDETEDEDCD